jgi:hypothetical protein
MKAIFVVWLVLFTGTHAFAADKTETSLMAAIAAGNLADLVTTHLALGSGHGVESNPVMSGPQMTAVKAMATVGQMYLVHKLWSGGHKRTALLTVISIGATYGVIAAHNYSIAKP